MNSSSETEEPRAVRHTLLYMGRGDADSRMVVGVSTYSFIREYRAPTTVKIHARTNKRVLVKSNLVCERLKRKVDPSVDIRYTADYGKTRLFFELNELPSLKSCCYSENRQDGFHLLGFLPQTQLQWEHQLQNANHMLPNESLMIGSRVAFKLLTDSLQRKHMFALCRYLHHVGSQPRLVALVPREEGCESPDGLTVLYLPFSDEISETPMESTDKLDSSSVSKFSQLVQQLTVKEDGIDTGYNPKNFKNPQYEAFLRAVKLQLEGVKAQGEIDYHLPDFAAIEEKAGPVLSLLMKDFDVNPVSRGEKSSVKLENAQKPIPLADFEEIKMRKSQGKLELLTIPKLSNFVKAFGYAPKKRKADLVVQTNALLDLASSERDKKIKTEDP